MPQSSASAAVPHRQERGRLWERFRWEECCELHALQTGSTSLSLRLDTTHLWAASQLHLHTCLEYLEAVEADSLSGPSRVWNPLEPGSSAGLVGDGDAGVVCV